MTNILFFSTVARDDKSVSSSSRSTDISEPAQTAAQASSSAFSVIAKAWRALARPQLQVDGSGSSVCAIELSEAEESAGASSTLQPLTKKTVNKTSDFGSGSSVYAIEQSEAEESAGASSTLQPLTKKNVSKTSDFGAILYIVWNLGFAVASIAVMCCSMSERPNNGIRVWIAIDSLFSVVAVILFVIYEYQARTVGEPSGSLTAFRLSNATLYFIWWFIGILWAFSGYEIFLKNAPRLAHWTTILTLIPPFLLLSAGFFACCYDRLFTYTPSPRSRTRRRRFRHV